jgi:DNA repair exonuclease SbcCD ATPase subunit
MLGYSTLMVDVQDRLAETNKQDIIDQLNDAYRKWAVAKAKGLVEEENEAKERLEQLNAAYSELQANLSDQRKVRERMETLRKEQDKRYKEATDRLWTFNFDHASTATQQQMARSAFFKAQNQFEGARTDDDRETALQEMQTMYGKMDQQVAEMPAWNGMLRTTAGAVESDSVAAQELQERVLNDFNRILVDNAQQQTVIQQAMKNAMEQMVKNTDPNTRTFVGGHS